MHIVQKTFLSALAGITSTGVAHMLTDFGVNDLLRPLGLERRRSSWPQNLACLGAGIVVGGVGALLLAPASGAETRAKVAKRVEELGEAATKQAQELRDQVRHEIDAPRASSDNNQPPARTDS
jgi:hypothetical protein